MADTCCGTDAPAADEPVGSFWSLTEVRLALVAGAALVAAFVLNAVDASAAADLALVVALASGGWTFVPESLSRMVKGRLGVGALMTIAAAGAVVLGELGEAASLAFLFSISEALEGFALTRTRQGLRALLALVPELVTVRRAGGEVEISPKDLILDDVMVVGSGDRVATDGVVATGRSVLDLSAITGESVPVEVEAGSVVHAAAINGGGVLEVRVTATTADSSLARVVHIVEEAQERKGGSQRLAERIAAPLVPGILVIAASVAIVGSLLGDPETWVSRALVVLVAAAPCAFAIAVPVTVVTAVGAAARMGALIKGGAALEALCDIDVVALDKTGTLTANEPKVIATIAVHGASEAEVLAAAGALELRSEHPLAGAILDAAGSVPAATDVQAVIGHGLTGVLGASSLRLGKPGFIQAGLLTEDVERLQGDGATVVLVERDGALLGAIAVRDELRPEAPEVIARLRQLGVGRAAVLTGDNERTAAALAAAAGVTEVHAGLLPEDKARIITDLQRGGKVAMVGDGINDAPALATADVGLAMGAVGSDVAIEAADVALMGEQLSHLPDTLAHAQRAKRIMVQNLVLSGLIIGTLVPLAAAGVMSLATVVASHELAEVLVIGNGIRAGRRPTRSRRS